MRTELFGAVDGVEHGFGTRHADAGGGSALLLHQVHGTRIVSPGGAELASADGWFALRERHAGVRLGIRTADCVPLLIADRGGRALAAVHSGWRGTAAGIATAAVERFAAAGIAASELLAALGPAISGERYEVGPEVVDGLGEGPWVDRRGERPHVDLRGAIAAQLLAAGLDRAAIAVSPHCTHRDAPDFHSYRRDGERAGRMIACIGWAP